MNFLRTTGFEHRMSRGERFAAWGYLPIHLFVLPIMLALYIIHGGSSMTEAGANLPYYLIGFAFCVVCTRKFLRAEFDAFLDNFRLVVFAMVAAYVISMAIAYLVAFITLAVGEFDNPNQQYIEGFAMGEYNLTFAAAVFLAPLVEETLFRGLIFGSIRVKSRPAAYVVSVLVFSIYHVWQFMVASPDPRILFYALQYVPMSVALAYCYERSGSLWTPVFYHMLNNFASMLLMKYSF